MIHVRTRRIVPVLLVCMLAVLAVFSLLTEAQDAGSSPIIEFTAYPQNPVFTRETDAEWGGECGTIFAPHVIRHNDLIYLFYSGSCQRSGKPAAVGFATSPDGINWTRYAQNPILEPDGEGYDAMCVSSGVPLVEDDQWVLYYAANSTPCSGPGQHIGRAVADDPAGPWERESTPVLEAGTTGDWDEGFIMPHAVIHTDAGYVMYFSAGQDYLVPLPRLIGMATSPDGIHWTKYDDPATTEAPYANSDPILELNPDGTEQAFAAWAVAVLYGENGWEMMFSDTCPDAVATGCPSFIGYATSEDGLHWRAYRTRESVVLTRQQVNQEWASYCVCHPTFIHSGAEYLLFFSGCTGEFNDCQIGLATGSITWQPAAP